MNSDRCSQLDDYLDGDMPADEKVAFDLHLHSCAACGLALAHWCQTAKLLRAANGRETKSRVLVERVEVALSTRQRKRLTRVVGAGMAIAAAIWLMLGRIQPPPSPDVPPEIAELPPPVVVTFPDRLLAVREETGSSNVTFYWVFPQLNATAAGQRSLQ